MYGQYGTALAIENVYSLAAPFLGADEKIKKMADLKPAYVRFLKSVHPGYPIQTSHLIVREEERLQAFAKAFSASTLDDLQQEKMVGPLFSTTAFEANARLLQQALDQLTCLNRELADLFNLVIHGIMLCNSGRNHEGSSAHGGTSNRCIGLIWLNINPEMSVQNIIEMLIHEFTHTLVFLDEVNHEQFNYENVTKQPYWAISSILKRRRPMDKVLHSVIVSMEILHARRNYLPLTDESKLVHPNSKILRKNIEASISSALEHPLLTEVCKPRAIELLVNAQKKLSADIAAPGEQDAIVL